MTDLTTYPLIDGFETTLAQAWDGAVGTIYLNSVPDITFPSGVTTYLVVNPGKTTMQIAEIDSVNTTNITANCTNVTLDKGAGEAYTQSSHGVGSIVRISHNYQFWKDIADAIASKLDTSGGNGLEYADTTARDAALGGNGAATKNYRMVKAGSIYYNYNLSTGQWETVSTGTATPNASPTVSGSLEVPTATQMTNGTQIGETGAYLAVTPDLLAAQIQSGSYVYANATNGNDTYTANLTPALTAYTTGMVVILKTTTANTGACTLNINGLGAKSIKTRDGDDPQDGVIRASGITTLIYDGTNFVITQADFATTANKGIAEKLTNAEALSFSDTERFADAYQLMLSNQKYANAKFMFNFMDDFINTLPTATAGNGLQATISGTAAAQSIVAGANNRPGIIFLDLGTTGSGVAALMSAVNAVLLGGGVWTFEALIQISSLSTAANRTQNMFGFFDDVSAINQTDGVFFLYDNGGVSTGSASSANRQIVCCSNGTRTFTTTSVAVGTSRTKLRIVVNAAGNSVEFFINDTSVGTITTNIPTAAGRECGFGVHTRKSASSLGGFGTNLDYIAVDCLFTTSR